jgi:Skp family chaperone for outer membrane proteins
MQLLMKTIIFSMLFVSFAAFASTPSYELACRAKAKEIAAETYRGCVTENKTAEIARLRRDYQEKLKNLKNEYEAEVTKLGAKKSAKRQKQMKLETETDESQMDLPEPIPVEMSPDKNI